MILAVLSTKGGTGKSTVALNLTGALSRANHKVLLIDADPQGSIARWAKEGRQDSLDVLVHPDPVAEKKVQKKGKKYDLVIFDSPPTFKKRVQAVLQAADRLIIPVTPGMADVWSTARLIDMYLDVKEKRPNLDARLLINRVDRRTRLGREFRGVLERLSIPIFLTEIPQRAAYGEAWLKGMTVDRLAPKGAAAQDFRRLSREVLQWIAKGWLE